MSYRPEDASIRIETQLGSGSLSDLFNAVLDIIERERLDPKRIQSLELDARVQTDDGTTAMWELSIEGRRLP